MRVPIVYVRLELGRSMGFINAMRDLLREHGAGVLRSVKDVGKIVAPTLTKSASQFVHKNSRLIDSMSQVVNNAFDVADAATVGDLAGGLHAGVHLGQSVGEVFGKATKGAKRKRGAGEIPEKLQTKKKRVGTDASGGSSMEQFDSGSANDPKISADLLARMTKSVRSI